eukprot:m.12807 g.12807  ORF g.12807 m.12807 type:complete len:187 (-) comp7336_c1_seq1:31-591(-)
MCLCLPSTSHSFFFFCTDKTRPILHTKLVKMPPPSKALLKMQKNVRIGGKGTPRRKKKVVRSAGGNDDSKLFSLLKKNGANTIGGVEEVNLIRDDGTVVHFDKPKVQAAVNANTFCISGNCKESSISELLPGILPQLGAESLQHLKTAAQNLGVDEAATKISEEDDVDDDVDDEVPELEGDFDSAN